MRNHNRRTFVVAGTAAALLFGGVGLAVATPTPPHATGVPECEQSVRDGGYPVGSGVTHACNIPAPNPPTPTYGERNACRGELEALHVESSVAIGACGKV